MTTPTTPTTTGLRDSIAPFLRFFNGPIWARNAGPGVSNFAVGNPQEMPLAGYVEALRAHLEPQGADWFAYKLSEPRSQAAVARGADRTDRPRLGSRRRRDDERWLRGPGGRLPGDPRAGRRGRCSCRRRGSSTSC